MGAVTLNNIDTDITLHKIPQTNLLGGVANVDIFGAEITIIRIGGPCGKQHDMQLSEAIALRDWLTAMIDCHTTKRIKDSD